MPPMKVSNSVACRGGMGETQSLTVMIDCTIWEDIVSAAIYVNPCFNFYHLTGKFRRDYCSRHAHLTNSPFQISAPSSMTNSASPRKVMAPTTTSTAATYKRL